MRPVAAAILVAVVLSVAGPALAGTEVLDVPGFRPAVTVMPPATGARRPVVVALHGNYDRPEWQCEVWSRIFGEGAVVLCPRGVPRTDAAPGEDRWTWDGPARTEAEVDAALAALRKVHGARLDERASFLVGFSLGATMAARIGTRNPEAFSRLVLVEGGDAVWTLPIARRFMKGGGSRVLAACGQAACLARFRNLSWAFRTVKVPFLVVGTAKAGHTYDGDVADAVSGAWSWLTEGDERFGATR